MIVKDYILLQNIMRREKYSNISCAEWWIPVVTVDLNCEVYDLLLELVDLKQELPDLRFGGIPPILPLVWGFYCYSIC